MFTLPPKKDFAATLLRWFDHAMRPLPWRKTYDPYSVWISEIMLQQTQMERGVLYFNKWMRQFPTIQSVAEADEQTILAAWEGLGYYSRARNLHQTAKIVVTQYGGRFPDAPAAIRALPGIGDYTAAAIAAIAFNLPEPAVDANVLRIFSRICDIDLPVSDKAVKTFVVDATRSLIPEHSPRLFAQALMELGALVCGKSPKCPQCPLARHCLAHRNNTAADRPRKTAKSDRRDIRAAAAVILRDGRILVRKRPPRGLWANMWELPNGDILADESPEHAAMRLARQATGDDIADLREIAAVRHGYTNHRATLYGYLCTPATAAATSPSLPVDTEYAWVALEKIACLAFPAGQRKLFERLGWKAGKTQ